MKKLEDWNIKYKSINYYISELRKAKDPLGILLNADFIGDLMDKEMKEKGIKNEN